MTRPGLTGDRAVALFLAALLAFNPPILSIFAADLFFFGLPLFYLYLFGAWGAVIVLIALHATRAGARAEPGPRGRSDTKAPWYEAN